MRSRLIFEVSSRFSNRYLLCRMVAISARKMHRDGASAAQSINRSLSALHDTVRTQDAVQQVEGVAVKILNEREEAEAAAAVPAG